MHRCDTTILVLLITALVLFLSRDDATAATIRADDTTAIRTSDLPPLEEKHSTVTDAGTARGAASKESVNRDSEDGKRVVSQVESSLLNMFGLKSRPRPRDPIQIPQYMIELYKQEAGISGEVQLNLGYERARSTANTRRYSGNTIRSFYHEGDDHGPKRPHHKVHLFFNVSGIPSEETLEGAELRLYRIQVNDSNLMPDTGKAPSSSINKAHRIDIHEVLQPATKHNEAITRLIDTRVVYPHKTKWESFDIEPAMAKWRRTSPNNNHGLEVHYTDMAGGQPVEEHVRLRRSLADFSDNDWFIQQPFLVAYTDDGKDKLQRQKRSADEQRESKRKRKSRDRAKQRRKKKNHCKRHPLYVDFQSVGWTDWIIAPPGYEAYFCHGECPFYMPDHLNATNHAIVQNMVNSFNPQAAPKPCCVPTELSDIAMLYLDEEGKVVLKTYQDMVVEACGCR